MAKVADLVIGIGADIDGFKKGMTELQNSMQTLGDNLTNAGQQIATSFGAVGLAVGGALGLAANKAMEFEKGLSDIKAVSGASAEDMMKLEELAMRMGEATKYSGVEAAKGIEELIKAGVGLEDIINGGLEGALSLAVAGELELADAAEVASTALNAFQADGLNVAKAADILAGGANASATSVGELKYGLSAVSAVASSVGMTFQDTTTALSLFAQNGLKGSDAGTSLKTMLMNLQPTTKDQIALFEELGLTTADGANAFFNAEGQLKSLSEISGLLQSSMGHLTDQQRLATMEMLFGSDAIRAANILYKEGAEGADNMWKAMSNVTAVEVMNEKLNNTMGRLEELKGSFETLQIAIGQALLPIINQLIAGLQIVVDWFNNLSPEMKTTIAIVGVVVAGLSLLVAGIGILMMFIGGLITAWLAIAPVLTAVAGVITGPVLLAIGALIAIIIVIIAYWEEIKAVTIAVWDKIWAFIKPAISAIAQFFKQKFDELKDWWMKLWPDLKKAFTNIWDAIVSFITPIIDTIVAIFKWAWPFIEMLIIETWESIKSIIDGALGIVTGLISAFAALFTGDWTKLWDSIEQVLLSAVTIVWELLQLWFVGKAVKVFKFFGDEIVKIGKAMWDETKSFFSDGLAWILKKLDSITEGVQDKVKAMYDFIVNMGQSFYNAGKGLIDMMKQGIENAASSVVKAVEKVAKKVRDFLPFSPAKEGPLSDLDKLDFAGPITDSIDSGLPSVQASMEHMLQIPSTRFDSSMSRSDVASQPVVVYLDGREIARGTLPHMVKEIQTGTGLMW